MLAAIVATPLLLIFTLAATALGLLAIRSVMHVGAAELGGIL